MTEKQGISRSEFQKDINVAKKKEWKYFSSFLPQISKQNMEGYLKL